MLLEEQSAQLLCDTCTEKKCMLELYASVEIIPMGQTA